MNYLILYNHSTVTTLGKFFCISGFINLLSDNLRLHIHKEIDARHLVIL